MTSCPNCGYTFTHDQMPLSAEQVHDLKRCVLDWTGVDGSLWLSSATTPRAVKARRVAIEIMRHKWELSTPDIARVIGRDRSSVTVALRRPLPPKVAWSPR